MSGPVTPRPAAPVRWAKVIDQTRCIGCHACTTACKSENEVPLGVTPHLREVRRRRPLPAGAPRVSGDALQPVRRAALRVRVPHRRDVPAAGRHRRLRQERSASAARPASPPAPTTRSSSTPTTTRPRSATSARIGSTSASSRPASSCARPRRSWSGDLNDPHLASVARSSTARPVAVRRPEKETRPEALLQGRAPGDARSARGAAARRAASSSGASRAAARSTSRRAIPARPTARPPRCSPTTCRTARRGTGG